MKGGYQHCFDSSKTVQISKSVPVFWAANYLRPLIRMRKHPAVGQSRYLLLGQLGHTVDNEPVGYFFHETACHASGHT